MFEHDATHWSDALSSSDRRQVLGGQRFANRIVDAREVLVERPADVVFRHIRRVGGTNGWYYGDWLWSLRGFIDLLFGGVGLRRGRRDPDSLVVGDVVDFWRVEDFEPDRRLRLRAEMKLPGRAWLEFQAVPHGSNTLIRQIAIFDPVGFAGLAYWHVLYPVHMLIFAGMLRGIKDAAQSHGS
jgi:hypothetical protein